MWYLNQLIIALFSCQFTDLTHYQIEFQFICGHCVSPVGLRVQQLLHPCPSARPGWARARKITEGSRRRNGSFARFWAAENRLFDGKAFILLVPRRGAEPLSKVRKKETTDGVAAKRGRYPEG